MSIKMLNEYIGERKMMRRFYWYKLSAGFSRYIGGTIRDSKREDKISYEKFKSLQENSRKKKKEVYYIYIYIITTEKYRLIYDRARIVKIL